MKPITIKRGLLGMYGHIKVICSEVSHQSKVINGTVNNYKTMQQFVFKKVG